MKICIFGLSLSSSWGNGHATTWRALVKALDRQGHRVAFFERDVPWYAAHRDLHRSDSCDLRFYQSLDDVDRVEDELRDADAVVLGSYVPDGVALAEQLLRMQLPVLAFYDIDTPVTLGKLGRGDGEYLTPELIPRFDLYLSFSGGKALDVLTGRYGARMARPLYCGVDAELYRPAAVPVRWDLGYLGTYSADRQPALERLLIEPARQLPKLRFVVAGPQYPPEIVWPANVERLDHVAPADHAGFYAACRFSLNVTRAEMIRLGHSPSVRLFEAAACAAPIITDRWAGLEDFFEPGEEVVVADSTEDVVAVLTGSLGPTAATIGQAARLRVERQHTADKRAADLARWLREASEPASAEPVRTRATA